MHVSGRSDKKEGEKGREGERERAKGGGKELSQRNTEKAQRATELRNYFSVALCASQWPSVKLN